MIHEKIGEGDVSKLSVTKEQLSISDLISLLVMKRFLSLLKNRV